MESLSRPVAYTAPGASEAVTIKAIVRDVSRELRLGANSTLTHNAEATVYKSDGLKRGGTIEEQGVQYIIQGTNKSPVPGILNLSLRRVGRTGTDYSIEGYGDLLLGALGNEHEVVFDGQKIEAHVNLSTTVVDSEGLPIEDFVCVIGVHVDVADTMSAGDLVLVNSEDYRVQFVRRDGRGLAKVILR
tara:strand:- start:23802 stop:24365 length:564 start_codon:yes stop_codon:yes gene_type:complete